MKRADGPVADSARSLSSSAFGRFGWSAITGVLGGLLLAVVLLPLAALLFSSSPRALMQGLSDPLVPPALWITFVTTTSSLILVIACGTPLAWLMARRRGRAWRLIESVFQLPVVLPPAVAGVALLMAFGRRGAFGPALAQLGVGLPFTSAAVVLAQTFVSAPFYVQAALTGFRNLDPALVVVARSLGASRPRVFFTIAVPLTRSALIAGAALSWARALGEFGATLMFAGNMSGRTQTVPLAIYTALESDLRTAQSLSVLLLVLAFALLVAMRGAVRS